MEPPGSVYIPGGYFSVANGWTTRPASMKMPSKKQLDAFMAASGSRCSRQTTKGQKFRDEGLSGSYQHVVALLLTMCNLPSGTDATCTDVPCAWIVPPQAKKLEGNLPLSEIPFEQTKKRKREYDPTPGLSPADPTKFFEKLAEVSPSCLLLRYAKTHEPSRDSAGETDPVLVEPKSRCSPQPCIADPEDLLSERIQRFIQEAFDAVQLLSLDDRAAILESTMGQA
ncbi:hypothetical protein HPB52_003629 [Rhipicephalus sanguineus]|uniref:Uncharacterized protein n=1 Tax=Rhipicephalus sanguineus TaxID=34632 RepID=A0A9D4PA94_RHISA|nr:hypothetical protein HPB52_003629 [Rhipicephalus sanguineus]